MSYTVLARRYRSDAFGQVVGQEPIARTLLNAIATSRVAHAYLFCGTRGVGKTSMARLFARALNAPLTIADCPQPADADAYPAPDVQQRMAQAIMRGDDLNVIEIDGASNNRVEEARQLIAGAGLSPTGNARYKIYIIDEVHMLSIAAFNALLKTMEEPPSHVKFILCTTESHKVPATIQSRCQRFDFRNIPTSAIAAHLKTVLAKENLKAEGDLLWQVAHLGNGSMRDALSLLDRLISNGQQPLTSQLLSQMLGLPPQQMIVTLIDSLADGNVPDSLTRVAELLDQGISLDQVVASLIDRLHALMILAACGPDTELAEMAPEARAEAFTQAQRFDSAGLVHMLALAQSLQRSLRASPNPRALLDAVVVRLALAEKMADVTAILAGTEVPPEVDSTTSRARQQAVNVPPPPDAKKKGLSGSRDSLPANSSPPSTSSAPCRGRSQFAPAPGSTPAPGGNFINEPRASASGGLPPALVGENASPSADLSTPQLWQEVVAQANQRQAMAGWVNLLQCEAFDGQSARVGPRPGGRDLNRFLGDRQKQQLAEIFTRVLGRPVRVQWAAVPAPGSVIDESAADASRTAPRRHEAVSANIPGVAGAEPTRALSVAERRAVFDLPLVKQIAEQFEVSLISSRSAAEQVAAPDQAAAAASPPAAADDQVIDGSLVFDEDAFPELQDHDV
ncbi:MAG: DNA polymerase III subunit gamma/tau [Phycisphaeraceae bacterium]|nr:DNA polymerase III subunit gamma/tau [Phycisphaeraceae bacterium]